MRTGVPRILVLDGNPENMPAVISDFSQALPHAEVFTASSVAEALDLAEREDPDVVIVDINTARAGEYAVCREMRGSEKLQNVPLVFLTDSRTDQEMRICSLQGDEGVGKASERAPCFSHRFPYGSGDACRGLQCGRGRFSCQTDGQMGTRCAGPFHDTAETIRRASFFDS